MAYGLRFQFAGESYNGTTFRVEISQEGYTGTVVKRPLGAEPILRKEQNDGICGTSLDLSLECQVDGEFEVLYTSDPHEFKVDLYMVRDGGEFLMWTGFIAPEIYSDPDIAPPYDVEVTAVDGLGELKRIPFDVDNYGGALSLLDILRYLLGQTGAAHDIALVSSLRPRSPEPLYAANMLAEVYLDTVAAWEGKTCYDALQDIMGMLRATVTIFSSDDDNWQDQVWLICRESDLPDLNYGSYVQAVVYYGAGTDHTTAALQTTPELGNLEQEGAWWPVGRLTRTLEPARNRVELETDPQYIEHSDWESRDPDVGESVDDLEGTRYVHIDEDGQGFTSEVDFGLEDQCSTPLLLSFKVAQAGALSGSATDGTLALTISRTETLGVSTRTRYLFELATPSRSGRRYGWTGTNTSITISIPVPGGDNVDDAMGVEIPIPLYPSTDNPRDFARASYLTVRYTRDSSNFAQVRIYDWKVVKADRPQGYRMGVTIDNGARDPQDSIRWPGVYVGLGTTAFYGGRGKLEARTPLVEVDGEYVQARLWSDESESSAPTQPDRDLMEVIAREHARAVAAPLQHFSGTLNVPYVPLGFMPLFFNKSEMLYAARTWSWHLLTEDLEVELYEVPTAQLGTVTEDTKRIR